MVASSPNLEILFPVFALVGLTYAVWVRLFYVRVTASLSGEIDGQYYEVREGDAPPARERKPTFHLTNLFEVPVLFYALVAFLLITGAVDETFVTLAWAYVGFRVVHALVHLTYNNPMHRFAPYFAGCVVLLASWLRFFGIVLERC